MNPVSKFLCWCAGADLKLLGKYPEDVTKQSSIGLAVLFTGIFAMISGGYAAYRIFDYPNTLNSPPLDTRTFVFVGLLWGFLIFNLDRLIVLSVKKTSTRIQQFWTTLPRLVLAIIISLVVAKPLEVRIFQDRIADTLADIKLEEQIEDKNKIEGFTGLNSAVEAKESANSEVEQNEANLGRDCNSELCSRLRGELKQAINKLETAQRALNKDYNRLTSYINFIRNDKNSRHYTFSFDDNGTKIYRIKPSSQKELDGYVGERSVLEGNRNAARNEKNRIKRELDTAVGEFEKRDQEAYDASKQKADSLAVIAGSVQQKTDSIITKKEEDTNLGLSNNFIAQIGALGELTKWKTAEEGEDPPTNTLYWISLAIIILFIVVETAPIFVKAIAPLSAYDYALEEKLQSRREAIEKRKLKQELEHQMHMQKNSHSYESDIQHFIYTRSVAQSAALDSFNEIVDKWKENPDPATFAKLLEDADKIRPSNDEDHEET